MRAIIRLILMAAAAVLIGFGLGARLASASTINGFLLDGQGATNRVGVSFKLAKPGSLWPNFIYTSTILTWTTNATFSITLKPGNYGVQIGPSPDVIPIGVPNDSNTYNLDDLISTNLVYAYTFSPLYVQRIGGGGGIMAGNLSFSVTNQAGLIVNQLTTTQRNALTGTNGMIVYDSTLNAVMIFQNGGWTNAVGSSGGSGAPALLLTDTNTFAAGVAAPLAPTNGPIIFNATVYGTGPNNSPFTIVSAPGQVSKVFQVFSNNTLVIWSDANGVLFANGGGITNLNAAANSLFSTTDTNNFAAAFLRTGDTNTFANSLLRRSDTNTFANSMLRTGDTNAFANSLLRRADTNGFASGVSALSLAVTDTNSFASGIALRSLATGDTNTFANSFLRTGDTNAFATSLRAGSANRVLTGSGPMAASVSANTVYYLGASTLGFSSLTTEGKFDIPIQETGTIIGYAVTVNATGTDTATVTYALDYNSGTLIGSASVTWTTAGSPVRTFVTGLSQAVTAGSHVCLKVVTPVWGATPTAVTLFWQVLYSVP